MPNICSRKRVPRYRLHRASGQAIVTIDGRDVYLGKHGTTASREAYQEKIEQWRHSLQRAESRRFNQVPKEQIAAPDMVTTVTELIVAYVKFALLYYCKDGKPTNEVTAVKAALKIVRQQYGQSPVASFGPRALKQCREVMISKDWSRKHINKQVDRIKRMFKWGVEEEKVPSTVDDSLRCVAGLKRGRTTAREGRKVLPISDADVQVTIEHLPEVVADMVRLQRRTGMRPAEVCMMRPMDLDRSGDVWTYQPESHKTQHYGKERVVFVGPQAQSVLLCYLARDAADYCFQPRDSEMKRRAAAHAIRRTPMSTGNVPGSNCVGYKRRRPPGCHYTVDSYRRAIGRACDHAFPHPHLGQLRKAVLSESQAAELRSWRRSHRWFPNQLRHSAATEIRKRYGLEAAQVALGHAQANVTQLYAERNYTLAAKVAREVG